MIPSPLSQIPTNIPFKKAIKYKECLKNHAASMGGNPIDGCGEFMPNGEEGTIEALTCSACSCHINFHRKEIQEEPSFHDPISRYHHNVTNPSTIIGRKVFPRPHQMFTCSGNMESQDEGDSHGSVGGMFAAKNSPLLVKKRFRTKFTQNCSCLQKKLVGKCTSKKKVWCNSSAGRLASKEECSRFGCTITRRILPRNIIPC